MGLSPYLREQIRCDFQPDLGGINEKDNFVYRNKFGHFSCSRYRFEHSYAIARIKLDLE